MSERCLCGRGPVWHRDMCADCLQGEGRALDDLEEYAGADERPQPWMLAIFDNLRRRNDGNG